MVLTRVPLRRLTMALTMLPMRVLLRLPTMALTWVPPRRLMMSQALPKRPMMEPRMVPPKRLTTQPMVPMRPTTALRRVAISPRRATMLLTMARLRRRTMRTFTTLPSAARTLAFKEADLLSKRYSPLYSPLPTSDVHYTFPFHSFPSKALIKATIFRGRQLPLISPIKLILWFFN
ncbi:hypothetical protein F5H01DRAFT_334824 [Linnemannia elongata]|nr:hypothetical protein F5H01DRAFT_334824 [Linnemannia elongata]